MKPDTREIDHRHWGKYIVLSDQDDHKVKRIYVKPGERLSYQYHYKRDEHWFVVKGTGLLTHNDVEIPVKPGFSIDIKRLDKHRIANTGDEELVFIEVQTGDYFGEDDIVRIEDDKGRHLIDKQTPLKSE